MERKKVLLIIFGGIFLSLIIIIFFTSTMAKSGTPSMVGGGKLALVEINGTIIDSRDIIGQIERFNDDNSIKAIILRIDSPGGVVAPVQEIYEELTKIDKKIVVSMGSIAASGGYYIACAADYVFANPGTMTGSIGVIMHFPKMAGLMKKLGVEEEVVKSGKYKDASSIYRNFTPEERALFQETTDDVHNQFVDVVFQGRKHKNLNRVQIEQIADGRILSGRQALEKKLVDQLGNLKDAVEYTGKLVGIHGKPRVITIKPRRTMLERVINGTLGTKLDQLIQDHALLRYEMPL
jgi:protease-4